MALFRGMWALYCGKVLLSLLAGTSTPPPHVFPEKTGSLNEIEHYLKGVTKSGMVSRKMGFYPITKTEAQKCARLILMAIFCTVLAAGVPRHVYLARHGPQRLDERQQKTVPGFPLEKAQPAGYDEERA